MSQLTQLFSTKAEANDALAEATLEVTAGKATNARLFEAESVRVDDQRNNATDPSTFRRMGNPLYVVQVDYP